MGFAKNKSLPHVEDTDSRKKDFSCEMYGKIFIRERRRNRHFLTHMFENNYKCEKCGESFPRDYVLYLHLLIHRDKNFKCADCGQCFEFREWLLAHKLEHFEVGVYPCKDCKKYFMREYYFRNHKNLYCEKRREKIAVCGESNTTKNVVLNDGRNNNERQFQPDEDRDLNSGFQLEQINSGSGLQNNIEDEREMPAKNVNSHEINAMSEHSVGNSGHSSSQEKALALDENPKYENCAIFNLRIKGSFQENIQEEIEESGNVNEDFTPTTTLENYDRNIAKEELSELDDNSVKEETFEGLECFESNSQNNDQVEKQTQHEKRLNFQGEHWGDKSFRIERKLKRQSRIHIKEKLFQCDECKKCFSRKYILANHLRTHIKIEGFECAHCKKIFQRSTTLKLHQRIHTGEKPYQCNQCNRCFSQKYALKLHQRIHTGEKPYQCNQCKRCFSVKGNLTAHQRIHTGEKPYQCTQCNRCFCIRHDLKRHLRIHTGEKPYQCEHCNRCFTQKRTLRRHQTIHTGEKPFQCDECKKRFSLKYNLAVHYLRIHIREKNIVSS